MKTGPHRSARIDEELLEVYRHCTGEGCPQAAEHVMQALEALAQERPEARSTLDRAYLLAVRGSGSGRNHGN